MGHVFWFGLDQFEFSWFGLFWFGFFFPTLLISLVKLEPKRIMRKTLSFQFLIFNFIFGFCFTGSLFNFWIWLSTKQNFGTEKLSSKTQNYIGFNWVLEMLLNPNRTWINPNRIRTKLVNIRMGLKFINSKIRNPAETRLIPWMPSLSTVYKWFSSFIYVVCKISGFIPSHFINFVSAIFFRFLQTSVFFAKVGINDCHLCHMLMYIVTFGFAA